jgi:hypothetical protein
MTISEWYSSNLPFGCSRSWAGHWDVKATVTDTDPRKHYDEWNRDWFDIWDRWLRALVSMNRQFVRGWVRDRSDWRFKARTDGKVMWNRRALP